MVQPLVVDCVDWTKLLPNPPLINSFQLGWSNIQLAHYHHSSCDLPEISNTQHIVLIPLANHPVDLEFVAEGRPQTLSYREKDYANGCIELYPTGLPISLRSHSTVKAMEVIQCYLEPTFLAQVAHESVNPDRVELLLTLKKPDLLIHQIGLSLRASLEEDGVRSRFYADSLAVALSTHLLRYYSTRKQYFRKHEDGLSKGKLRQAIEYIEVHLSEDLSLSEIADELGMSQYYFCHLFKRSTGMTPHQYLIRQRVERSKYLLKQSERTITSIALDCGFANQSHFARCFRQYTGVSPKQFRKSLIL